MDKKSIATLRGLDCKSTECPSLTEIVRYIKFTNLTGTSSAELESTVQNCCLLFPVLDMFCISIGITEAKARLMSAGIRMFSGSDHIYISETGSDGPIVLRLDGRNVGEYVPKYIILLNTRQTTKSAHFIQTERSRNSIDFDRETRK